MIPAFEHWVSTKHKVRQTIECVSTIIMVKYYAQCTYLPHKNNSVSGKYILKSLRRGIQSSLEENKRWILAGNKNQIGYVTLNRIKPHKITGFLIFLKT